MSIQASNPSFQGILECYIADEFILSLKDAELHRTIKYKNTNQNSHPVSLEKKEISYHFHCEDFLVFVKDAKTPFELIQKDYVNKLKINYPTVLIAPGEELEIKIVCRWRDFYNYLTNLLYIFHYPDVTKYNLVFTNFALTNAIHLVKVCEKKANKGVDYWVQENSVHFKEFFINPNEIVKIELFSISTPNELGILRHIKEHENGKLFSNVAIIIIQHLLSDAVHLIETFAEGGSEKDAIFIVGIPYSTKHPTVKYLTETGYKNIWTPSVYPFENDVRQAIEMAIQLCEKTGKKILIVEDGGYVVPMLHKEFIGKADLFIGAVEQTANGIWLDKLVKDKDGIEFCIPIINVAESKIKEDLESPLIGRAVSKNIELIYNKTFRGIAGVDIGLIGFGRTGSQVAKNLDNNGAILRIYDEVSTNRSKANGEGFIVCGSTKEVVKQSKIVVEATGRMWEENKPIKDRMDIILSLPHGSYFVSASSKRKGLDYEEFDKLIDKDKTLNIPGMGVRYRLSNDNEVTLIADGYPVNFFLGESVPDRDIAFILSLLYKSAEILVKNKNGFPKGIVTIDQPSDEWGLLAAQNRIAIYHEKKLS